MPSEREYMLDAQHFFIFDQGKQPIDVGMFTGMRAGVRNMFCKQIQPFVRGFRRNRAICLRQMVVDCQRPLAARFIFDTRHGIAFGVEQSEERAGAGGAPAL